jgi:hypothetical protein
VGNIKIEGMELRDGCVLIFERMWYDGENFYWEVMMSEENLVQVDVNETEEVVAVSQEGEASTKGAYKFLSVVVFLVTVMFAWFGANIAKNLVSDTVGVAFRYLFLFAGFYLFHAIRIVIKSQSPLTLKEGFKIENAEFSKKYTREELKVMTKEGKKERMRIYWSLFKFFMAVLVVGGILDIIFATILIQYV